MDDTDIRILKELSQDARLSYREIARRTGLAVGTVASRIASLEKSKVIKGYSPVLDAEKLGYDIIAIVEIVVAKGKLLDVEEKVAENPNVYGVYDVTGPSDAMVIARFRTRTELSRFVKTVLAMDYVDRTITHVALGTMKEDFRLPLE